MWKVRTHLHVSDLLIFVWAFGHFACYLLFSALTKGITGPGNGLSGLTILPVTTMASLVVAAVFTVATGWWRSATQFSLGRFTIPRPGPWTFLSGLCCAAIVATTTLAFTLDGVSIVFMMVWMRGGVMVMAPIVNALSRRGVHNTAWGALLLSVAAISLATLGDMTREVSGWAMGVIAAYLLAHLIRAQFLCRMARTPHPDNQGFFVEEQLVAAPALLLTLGALAAWGAGPGMHALRAGFTDVWSAHAVGWLLLIGVCFQGTGIFGALVQQENASSVSFAGVSSMLAGVLAGYALFFFADAPPPSWKELGGAALVIAATKLVSVPQRVEWNGQAALAGPGLTATFEGSQAASGTTEHGRD